MEVPGNDDLFRELERVRQQWDLQPEDTDAALTATAPSCAAIESGATAGVVSVNAANEIQK